MDEGLRLLLSLSLSGTILAGLTALVMFPLRRRAPRAFCYYLWLLVLLRFLCPLGADRSLSHQAVTRSETLWVVTGGGEKGTDGADIYKGENLADTDATMDTPAFVSAVLTAFWAGGALLVLGTRLWSGRRLRRALEGSAVPVQPWEQELYRTLGGRRAELPELLRTGGTQSPMLAGLLRPRIYLPTEEMPGPALGYALRHELVHWRRKDLWYKYALTAAAAIHWFNPAIWLLARAVERDCELSCDEAVAWPLSPEERAGYGRTLLWAAERQIGPPNGLSASLWSQKQVLKERLYAVMKPNQISKMTVALLAAAVLSLSAASAALGAYNGAEEPESQLPEAQPAQSVTDALAGQAGEESGTVQLAWPFADTEEIELSALYGQRVHPVTGLALDHRGIDIVLEEGTPVLASAPGTVQGSGFSDIEGNSVMLVHENGLITQYACLESNDFVQIGDTVEAGQQIGTVGKTGTATGYHLHFEVREDGSRRVDPLDYLPHSEVLVSRNGQTEPLKY